MCGGITKKNPDRYCDPDSGAGNQSRTDDLVITNDVLYQLSHASKIVVFSVDFTIISNFSPFVNPFLKIFSDSAKKDKKLVFAVTVWYSVDNQPVTAVYGGGHRATLYSSVVPRLHRRVKETTVPAGMPVSQRRRKGSGT